MKNSMTPKERKREFKGYFLIGIGLFFLIANLGLAFPAWFVGLPTLLIALGIYQGFKHNFQRPGWIILVLVGSVFMFERYSHEFHHRHLLIPMVLISIGVYKLVKSKNSTQSCDKEDRVRTFYNP